MYLAVDPDMQQMYIAFYFMNRFVNSQSFSLVNPRVVKMLPPLKAVMRANLHAKSHDPPVRDVIVKLSERDAIHPTADFQDFPYRADHIEVEMQQRARKALSGVQWPAHCLRVECPEVGLYGSWNGYEVIIMPYIQSAIVSSSVSSCIKA